MTCSSCGQSLAVDERFCGSCGSAVVERTSSFAPPAAPFAAPVAEPAATQLTYPAPGGVMSQRLTQQGAMKTGVEQVQLAAGEKLMATYAINRVHRPLGWLESYIVVTDSRVIHRAQASNKFNRSAVNTELQIAQVTGVHLDARRGLTPLGAAIMVAVGTFGLLMSLAQPLMLLLVLLALGLIWFLGRQSQLELIICGGAMTGAIKVGVEHAEGAAGIIKNLVAFVLSPLVVVMRLLGLQDAKDVSLAGLDVTGENRRALDQAVRMYDEIGALILEIRSHGVLAESRIR